MSKGQVLQKMWDNLPPERQQRIKARAATRVEEYRTLQALRKAVGLTQAKVSHQVTDWFLT